MSSNTSIPSLDPYARLRQHAHERIPRVAYPPLPILVKRKRLPHHCQCSNYVSATDKSQMNETATNENAVRRVSARKPRVGKYISSCTKLEIIDSDLKRAGAFADTYTEKLHVRMTWWSAFEVGALEDAVIWEERTAWKFHRKSYP